jgi:type III pantothenate kinase
MQPILFDLGNTTVKAWDTATNEFFRLTSGEFIEFLRSRPNQKIFGFATGNDAVLSELKNPIRLLSPTDSMPLKSNYQDMATLGLDRWGLCNSYFLEGNDSFLLLTMGTCITYNVVKGGVFLGGAISPGWEMRFESMHSMTANLPRAKHTIDSELLGTTTMGSLSSGVDVAIQMEIAAMIDAYSTKFDLKKVFICGGHSNRLSNHAKNYIFAPVNYELHALRRLHDYLFKNGTL